MSYIGNAPISAAFLVDTFSGTGSQTAFTMTVAPANTSSIIVAITGVLQDPSTYSVSGTTLTFSAAPPSGTSNISVRYLGIPASGVTTTAYRTVTEFTATSGQTSFSVPSYTVGYIDVYRNGVMLGTADFTATTGTTVVLASGATTGDLIRTESFYVSSVLNAIPNNNYGVTRANMPAGSVLQVVNANTSTLFSTTSTSFVTVTGVAPSITPSSTTSKILIMCSVGGVSGSNNGGTNEGLCIVTDGTNNYGVFDTTVVQPNTLTYPSFSASFLVSPATTSTLTYSLKIRCSNATYGIVVNNYWNYTYNTSSITLMEISV